MADMEELKNDIDKLADRLLSSEKDLYGKLDTTNATVVELNISVKLMVDKLMTFMKTFENHDTDERNKYDDIIKMFKQAQTETKKLEEKLNEKYITKEEMGKFDAKVEELSKAVKQGFKFFYIGTGIFITLGVFGGLVMWILDLVNKLQALGVH